MDEKKFEGPDFSAGENPVPLPPIEEAWQGMQKKLDATMPVKLPHHRFGHFSNIVGNIVTVVTIAAIGTGIWFATHKSIKKESQKNQQKTMSNNPVKNQQDPIDGNTTDPASPLSDKNKKEIVGRNETAPNKLPGNKQGEEEKNSNSQQPENKNQNENYPPSASTSQPNPDKADVNKITRIYTGKKDETKKTNRLKYNPAISNSEKLVNTPSGKRKDLASHTMPKNKDQNSPSIKDNINRREDIPTGKTRNSATTKYNRFENKENKFDGALKDTIENFGESSLVSTKGNINARDHRNNLQNKHTAPGIIDRKLATVITDDINSTISPADALSNRQGRMKFSDGSVKPLKNLPAVASNKKSNQKKHSGNNKNAFPFTIGLELDKNFAIAAQQTVSYNANAKTNLLSDYIPSPYIQFHLDKKLYLSAGFQFNSPQFITSLLVDTTSDVVNSPAGVPNYTRITTVQLKKLYYFNIPLTINYSPFENFFIGTGLQLSFLTGAVGLQQVRFRNNVGGDDSLYSSVYIKMKDYPIGYAKLKKTELRVLLETNYYWKRLSLGLRYQQSFSNYFSGAAFDPAGEKNAALGVYLRYNILSHPIISKRSPHRIP